MKAGRCPGKPGEDLIWQSDLPRKFDPTQSRFSALAEPCLKIVRALRRDLIPNGEAMLADQFLEAAAGARNSAALDETARLLWRAHAEGHIADANAEAISEALQARRAALASSGRLSQPRAFLGLPRAAKRPRSPDRQASIERRRRQAASGVVPSKIASSFTLGETAAVDGHRPPVSAGRGVLVADRHDRRLGRRLAIDDAERPARRPSPRVCSR